ncbi:collagen alpha-3(VI) chain-like [Pseudorasbora parva]|uniref:collagen alpha-3(VI) chain-like n=1 Tax=Pseudorasbora parva TaxID=51549 RepID=UPI00351F763F
MIVESLNVEEDLDRVAVVQKEDVLNAVKVLSHKGGRPLNTGSALLYVKENIFISASGSRHKEGTPQILILLTSGKSKDNISEAAFALKKNGVFIYGIGGKYSDLHTISSENNMFSLADFSELPKIQVQLLEAMKANPSNNKNELIAEGDRKMRDVVFLLDGSDATRNGFPAIKEFVQKMVEKLEVAENRDHVSVVQYSRDPETHFYLNTYMTKEEILDGVRGLRHKGGRPLYTGAALQYVRDNVFTASTGSRRLEGVPQILVLLSGGRSFDSVEAAASSLKELGILTFGIGSSGSDSRELQRISYDPNYALFVSDFTELPNVQEQLLASVQAVSIPITPTSLTVTADYVTPRKDVVFLLDGSDGTRNSFPAIRDFVQRLVEQFTIEANRDRVSVVQYSREAEVHFYLNSYTAKEDVLDRVRGLRHKGGRPLNTGAALQYVKDNVFTASTGSRRLEGVPQILILLSGGRSFDSVDAAASSLKELGVLTFGIGSRGSDSRELQRITYDPNYALSVSDFSELPNVQEQLLASVQEVAMPITSTSPTLTADDSITRKDVVFLLDGSDGTRNTFPAVREFVQRVVEQFNIEPNRDRVSVVQYSRDAEVNFYLNTYATKGEILNTVRGLRHRGGRPLNTGAALQYVRNSVFTASAGSRKQEGVPQILILLSGGRSSDNIDAPASALKESGVLIFGIGTRNSSREVQRIAGDPTYAQSINEFSDLPSVQQQFISSLNNVPVQLKPVTPTVAAERRMARRDVVFLLDGSDGTRSSFPAMRSFVERMVERLNVSENRDRVSVIQYSRDPEAHFYLNTYSIKEDVLDTLRGLRHKGGRPLNTGAALQYVRDNVFTASSGSRLAEGVPQLLILLSGGKSFDNVDTPASSLKELGVLVFAIGSRSSDSRELQKISHEPSYALSVGDFADLPSVQQQLFTNINTVFVEGPSITTMTIGKKKLTRLPAIPPILLWS